MKPITPLREAFSDPALLAHVLAGESWLPWRVLLTASMGEALTTNERTVFTRLTERERESGKPVVEMEVVAGRRAGKSTEMAGLATYIATCCEHSDALA